MLFRSEEVEEDLKATDTVMMQRRTETHRESMARCRILLYQHYVDVSKTFTSFGDLTPDQTFSRKLHQTSSCMLLFEDDTTD